MENKITLNFDLLMNESLLDSLKPRVLKNAKFLFVLWGFGIGSFVSLITIIIEDLSYHIPVFSTITNYHHIVAPVILGVIGGIWGGFYEKRIKEQRVTYRALYESQQTLKLITDNLPSLISYIDENFRYQFVNKTHTDWLQMPLNKIKGRHIKEILGEDAFNNLYPHIKKALDGEIVNFENTGVIRKSHRVYLNSTVIPHFDSDNTIKGIFVLVTDITNLKKRENKIKSQKKELQKINATKDKLFSVIGHDLKNPFNSILGFSELLSEEIISLSKEDARDIAIQLKEKSNQAYNLLTNLLDWSRTQLKRIESSPEKIALNKFVDEIMEALQDTATHKNIKLLSRLRDDIYVYADRNMMLSVFRNLLNNAIKFTRSGGQIEVDAENRNNYIKISLRDNGVGIDPEHLSHLFNLESEFTTAGTDNETGTGLGLMICKEFIELNRGKMWINSVKGEGTTIHFTLPVPND